MKSSWVFLLALMAGLVALSVAIFAHPMGVDPNKSWGAVRILMFLIGILVIFFALVFRFVPSRLGRIYFLAGPIGLLVLATYLWFGTVGYWTIWPTSTNYYDQLGTAFQHGELSLQIKPDPALLALPDPYDVQARKAHPNIPYVFDGSLYGGKFYLYWGPAPALILALVKFAVPGEIGDQYLVFTFVSGLFLFQSLLVLRIWRRFFQNLPAWTVLMGLLTCGLTSPMTWLINQPEIYEASIAAGQFFLIGGLYFALTAIDRPSPASRRLVITGILWSCAIGSRVTLALPTLLMVVMIFLWFTTMIGQKLPFRTVALASAALVIPLALGAILLGWYNWARFGSFFETGFRYVLSGINYHDHTKDIFLASYVPSNLQNYLFTPFKNLRNFPFIKPISGARSPFLFAPTPEYYNSLEHMTGLLYTAPFFLFAFLSIAVFTSKLDDRRSLEAEEFESGDQNLLRWISISLTGISLLTFGTVLLYFYCTMRFDADFTPAISLLALLGFWQGFLLLERKVYLRFSYSLIAIALATATILISTLLAVSGYKERFVDLNPSLLKNLVEFFAH